MKDPRWTEPEDLPEALPEAEASQVCTEYWVLICAETDAMTDAAIGTAWRNGALRHELGTGHSTVFDSLMNDLWTRKGS